MSNRLKNETSPYLLQHRDNPVDWYPWSEEAFEKARKEDKPIFLSIGYSTCHWCHVMAHESFEDAETAGLLNQYFVSIKVDREERPDIDTVYMAVCQAFTGSGGWPMSIFMTWDKKPFFAGTYFPPKSGYGMPGFPALLKGAADEWDHNREELLRSAEQVIAHFKESESLDEGEREDGFSTEKADGKLFERTEDEELFGERAAGNRHGKAAAENLPEKAMKQFSESFDHVYGGFREAPKFPVPHNLWFLMLYANQNGNDNVNHKEMHKENPMKNPMKNSMESPMENPMENPMEHPMALEMVEKTLTQMRKGGIFDQIGYGFSRYSTDRYYLAPHFEKMLYDNALLIIAYGAAYEITQKPFYLDTAEKTAQYVLREMTFPKGGFYSAQDADSEGVEGKFYTFTLREVLELLGEEKGRPFAKAFDITEKGNFEGVNIPNLLTSHDLEQDFSEELQELYHYRAKRTKLHLDDKILVSWNSMMIAALSMLYRVSRSERYLQAAVNAQMFLEKNLIKDGRLRTSWRGGVCSGYGFLDDYAFYIAALMELYHSTLKGDYLEKARWFCDEAVKRFWDEKRGGFYLADSEDTELFMNPKESYDGAVPSGNSVMAYNFVRLYQLTEKEVYRELAEKQMDYMTREAHGYPAGHSMFLVARLLHDNPPEHITVVLKDKGDLEKIRGCLPFLGNVMVTAENEAYPLLNGKTTFYVCKNHTCFPPVNEI